MSTLGVLAHAATERGGDELRRLERATRMPLPVRRRIAIAALGGGVGCTTTTMRLLHVLASRRDSPVLAVDAQGSAAGAVPFGGWPAGVTAARLEAGQDLDQVERLAADHPDHDLTVCDWGAVSIARLQHITQRSHAVCLVAPTERPALQRALDVAAAIHRRFEISIVLAVVDVRRIRGPRVADGPIRAIRVPYDARLARSGSLPGMRTRDALAALRLASAVVDAAAASRRHPAVPV